MAKRITALLLLCFLFISVLSVPVYAADGLPTGTFTHHDRQNGTKESVPLPDIYTVTATVNARSIGLKEGFEQLSDIACDKDGNLYMLSNDSRLFLVDGNYKLIREITVTNESGEAVDYAGAKGIYLSQRDSLIYIADTSNGRVIATDYNGRIVRSLEAPDSSVIPDDFQFIPFAMSMDSKGVLYVLSDGAYYGALMFDKSDSFIGFYGANTVSASPLTLLANLWDRLTKNDTKRKYAIKKLPYQFLNMYIDPNDFVYTCTGRTSSGTATGQIKMLSPSGTNILYKTQWSGKKTDAGGFNFGETDSERRNNKAIVQNFTGLAVDGDGYIYALDNTYGLIYVYDNECRLLGAFGGGRGEATVKGAFTDATDLCFSNGRLMVCDAGTGTVTVFEKTAFGELLFSARKKTLSSDYQGSAKEWREVLKYDAGNRLAYSGLAKEAFWREDYETAMEYAEKGFDFVTYGQAKEKITSDAVQKNFLWIFIAAILVVGALLLFVLYTVRHNVVFIKNEKIRILSREFLHPFETFNSIKYKSMGSLPIAFVLLFLWLVSSVVLENYSNFRYTTFNTATTNSLFQLLRTVGFAVLAVIANWAVCVLLEGKGKFKHIFIAVSYSVLPLIIGNFVNTVLSHQIASPDSTLISGISLVCIIITGILITVGLMVIHEYSLPKFLISVLLTLVAMILAVFMLFMVGMLVSQLWSFLNTIFMEATYR